MSEKPPIQNIVSSPLPLPRPSGLFAELEEDEAESDEKEEALCFLTSIQTTGFTSFHFCTLITSIFNLLSFCYFKSIIGTPTDQSTEESMKSLFFLKEYRHSICYHFIPYVFTSK